MRKLIFAILLGTGCMGGGSASYRATATVSTPMPDMVYVDNNVQVIADYDEPVFYTDGYYWRYYGNTWYRSDYYTGGWVYASPPRALLRIERPHTYVRYRPNGYVARRPARVYRDRDDRYWRQNQRDHRRDDRRYYRR
jgi:hypothetical protein